MIAAFVYLSVRTLHHRLARQVHRLREPRYLIAIVVGGLYLYYFLFRPRPGADHALVTTTWLPLAAIAGLLAAAVRWWVFGGDRSALAFSPAEVQFLFPAPVTRRSLLHWKLLRLQMILIVNTVIWAFLLRRGQAPGGAGYSLVAIYVVFATLSLHRLGSSLARAGLREHAGRTWLQLAPGALVIAACLALAGAIGQHWAALSAGFGTDAFGAEVQAVLAGPVVSVVLWPVRALLAPVFAATHQQWARAMIPAAGLLLLHYLWVLRSDTAFEEAAVAASAERARRLTAIRQGRGARAVRPATAGRPAWFPLAPTGWPGTAFLWKNVVASTRNLRPAVLIIPFVTVAAILGGGSVLGESSWADTAGFAALALTGMLLFFGPIWIRNDLRGDLGHLDLLRSYPLRGRTVAAGEIAASVLLLTTLELALLLLAFLAFLRVDVPSFPLAQRAGALALAIGLLPALNALTLTLQNTAALLFPEWVNAWGVKSGGVETMGQNVVTMTLSLALTLLGALGPALAGGLTLAGLYPFAGRWAAVPASAAALTALAVELYLLLMYVGHVYERGGR